MNEIHIRGHFKSLFEHNGQALLQVTADPEADGERSQTFHVSPELAREIETIRRLDEQSRAFDAYYVADQASGTAYSETYAAELEKQPDWFRTQHRIFVIEQIERDGKTPRFELLRLEDCNCERC
jgi:hypothetical protein